MCLFYRAMPCVCEQPVRLSPDGRLSKMPVMVVRQRGQSEETYQDMYVRTDYVRRLLYWLKRVHFEVYSTLRDAPERSEAVFARLSALGCDAYGGASVQAELGAYELPGVARASETGPAQHTSFAGATTLDMGSSTVLQSMPHAGRATMVQRSLQLNGEVQLSQDPDLQRQVDEEARSEAGARAARRTRPDHELLAWPGTSEQPVNELSQFVAVAAFPLRFYNTLCDINVSRPTAIPCDAYFESLLWYWDGKYAPCSLAHARECSCCSTDTLLVCAWQALPVPGASNVQVLGAQLHPASPDVGGCGRVCQAAA